MNTKKRTITTAETGETEVNPPVLSETIAIATVEAIPLDQNPAAVYLASLRESGRHSMLHHLNVIAGIARPGATALTLPWYELRYQHTATLRSLLQERYAPATANTAVKALRRVLKEAWKLGLMSAEDYRRAVELPTIKSETLPRGRALEQDELKDLFDICGKDPSPAGARDAAIVAIAYGAGLRRSEIVALNLADYNQRDGSLKILGAKGGKDRLVYIGSGGKPALVSWIKIRGNIAGALFNPVRKNGHVVAGQRMTAQVVRFALQKRRKLAGLAEFSPHDLRRTFISDLLDAGADIATVQKLAGHASVETTARYDRRGEAAKQKAAGMLSVPYTKSD